MRYTTRTEYGLVCMVYLAKQHQKEWVTIKELTVKENYPVAYIEKILQGLRRANLVVSHQGNQGGYSLARPANQITLREIIEALEGTTFDVFCQPDVREDIVCTHFCLCGIKPIWRRTKNLLDGFFDSITLEMLEKNELEMNNLLHHAGEAKHAG